MNQHPSSDVLLAFHQHQLDVSATRDVDTHLADCPSCAARAAGFHVVADSLGALQSASSSAVGVNVARVRLRNALDAERRVQQRAWRPQTVFAAVGFALVSGAAIAGFGFRFVAPVVAPTGVLSVPDVRTLPNPTEMVPAAVHDLERASVDDLVDARGSAVALGATSVNDDVDARVVAERSIAKSSPGPSREGSSTGPTLNPSTKSGAGALDRGFETVPAGPRIAKAPGTLSSVDAYAAEAARLVSAKLGDPALLALGDLAAMSGDVEGALKSYVRAHGGQQSADADRRIETLIAEGLVSENAALTALMSVPGASETGEGMRRVCATKLRQAADHDAVMSCRSFGQRFPEHPAVRRLALAAGRTAEFRLDDLTLAVEEYSRAILVSDFAGLSSTEALFARARARAKLGQTAEGRSDLRLYLHVQPESRFRDDVAALAKLLDVDVRVPPGR